MGKLSEEYCCGPEPLCDEGIKTKCRLAQLEGAWENAGHRCPQCGTGNPKVAQLEAALEEIAKGEGPFSRDRLKHAENTITNLVTIAKKALEAGEEPWDKEVVGDEEWY